MVEIEQALTNQPQPAPAERKMPVSPNNVISFSRRKPPSKERIPISLFHDMFGKPRD